MSSSSAATPASIPPPSTATAPHKHTRILACVLCQHRKIKCDRQTPCSNCVKANVTCTPSTPAPARKRRRPNQDLQERLARCEKLLQQYAAGGSPPPPDSVQSAITPTTTTVKAEMSDSSPNPANDSQSSWKTPGRMVQEDGGARFMDSHIWATMSEELQAMRSMMENDEPDESSILSPEDLSPDNQSDLLLSGDMTNVSIEDLLPDPVHIFRLWQIFLDRVNPLTKIIHVPTVQPYVMDLATNLSNVPLNFQALLFSIFSMAAVSLDQTECVQLLGISREKATVRFNTATKAALVRSNFMKQFNMTSLQALLLYMQSLEGRWDKHAAWVFGGVLMRMAQKMGYHRDGEQLKLNPFETEMRRRIWWQILLQDSKLAHLSGLNMSQLPTGWDTKDPSNLNDADIFPGSGEPVQARDGPTEMIFCIMMCEMLKFNMRMDNSEHGQHFEAALLGQLGGQEVGADGETHDGPTVALFNTFRADAKALEERLLEIEQKYCDPSAGNVHIAALTLRPRVSCHLGEILLPLKEHAEYGTEIFDSKDVLFKLLAVGTEHRAETFDQMTKSGFQWFVRFNFPDEVFAVLASQLMQRPTGSLSDRAWKSVERTYANHTELYDMTLKNYAAQAQLTLRAWKVREAAYAQSGWSLETPAFIKRLRDLVPDMPSSTPSSANTHTPAPAPLQQQQQASHPLQPMQQDQNPEGMAIDPFVGNYMETTNFNWDMLGDMMANNGDQLSAAMLSGYGLGNMNVGNMGNMGGMGGMGHM